MKPIFLFGVLFSLLISSCGSFQAASGTQTAKQQPNEIVFHDFLATKNGNQIQIVEIEQVTRAGQIKESLNHQSSFDHPVQVKLGSPSGRSLKKLYINHPLIRDYEYLSDQGHLQHVTTVLDSATFTLRYNMPLDLHTITFTTHSPDSLRISQTLIIQ